MPETVKPGATTLEARESLPEELRGVFDQLLEAYKYHTAIAYGGRMFPPKVIAALVRDGWRKK